MDREHVVAQPHARIGEPRAGRLRGARQRLGERAAVARLDPLLEPQESRALGLEAPVDPARHEPVVVVAGHHHQLAVGAERLAQVGEHGHRQLGDVALGAIAQLDAVAEDHQAVDAAHRLEQRLAQLRPAEQVGALGGADVEVGDDERAHGRNTLGCLAMPPLDGLLVADFSRVLAGPYATMVLGDLGADVVKVERPGTGDDTRAWGPPWAGSDSTYYLVTNRNKRSVALDLTDEGDRELARRLGERADVLVESFRPGLMAEWGLDGDTLRERNPGLVSCSVTAFGTGEAGRTLPGYDFLLQAMGGLMHVTGDPDGPPTKVGAAVVDLIAGCWPPTASRARCSSASGPGAGATSRSR